MAGRAVSFQPLFPSQVLGSTSRRSNREILCFSTSMPDRQPKHHNLFDHFADEKTVGNVRLTQGKRSFFPVFRAEISDPATYFNKFRKKGGCENRKRRGYFLPDENTKKGNLFMTNDSVSQQEPAWPRPHEKQLLQVFEQSCQDLCVPAKRRAGRPVFTGRYVAERAWEGS